MTEMAADAALAYSAPCRTFKFCSCDAPICRRPRMAPNFTVDQHRHTHCSIWLNKKKSRHPKMRNRPAMACRPKTAAVVERTTGVGSIAAAAPTAASGSTRPVADFEKADLVA